MMAMPSSRVIRGPGRRFGARAVVVLALASGLLPGAFVAGAFAQDEEGEGRGSILLVLDSSGSMKADDGTGRTKLAAAKAALNQLVDRLPEGAPVGLRVYGARGPRDDKARGCRDTQLISPVAPLEPAALKRQIASFDARGFTPIGRSLEEGAKDLPDEGDRTMILVSDGVDTCGRPDPCAVAKKLSREGLDLTIQSVGYQVDAKARRQLKCIADATGGGYFDVEDSNKLGDQLEALAVRTLRRYRTAGTPVKGGLTRQEAPLVGSGQYLDTIRPGEERWYAVRVEAAQTLSAGTTTVGTRQVSSAFAADVSLIKSVWELALHDSAGEELQSERMISGGAPGTHSHALSTDGGTGPPLRYVRVSLEDPDGALPVRDFPVELLVQVGGTPEPPADTPAQPRPDEGVSADPPGPLTVAAVLAFLGAAVGALAVALRRRRTA
jgi:Ca-activated chloride channel family protein